VECIIWLIETALSSFPLIAVGFSFILAQIIKVLIYWRIEGELNLWHFFQTGGMPSTHSASVSSLTLAIALTSGINSPLFATCLVFALIVMYDATGVRRAAGEQALILNKMIGDLYKSESQEVEKLREILGHEPVEVVVGSGLAILVTLVTYYVYFIR
jgi:hypothetical protein